MKKILPWFLTAGFLFATTPFLAAAFNSHPDLSTLSPDNTLKVPAGTSQKVLLPNSSSKSIEVLNPSPYDVEVIYDGESDLSAEERESGLTPVSIFRVGINGYDWYYSPTLKEHFLQYWGTTRLSFLTSEQLKSNPDNLPAMSLVAPIAAKYEQSNLVIVASNSMPLLSGEANVAQMTIHFMKVDPMTQELVQVWVEEVEL